MSRVVDWKLRANQLESLSRVNARDQDDVKVIDIILRATERDEPDAEPVKAAQPAFAAGQWVREIAYGAPYQVLNVGGGKAWLSGCVGWAPQDWYARIPDRPSDEWMRDNAPGWRLTGRVEDCRAAISAPYVTANDDDMRTRIEIDGFALERDYDGYRWTVERIPESDALRADLASIRARLDEIAAKVGAA